MRDQQSVRAALVDLGLPQIVLDLFDGRPVDPLLVLWCAGPYYSFTEGAGLPLEFLPMWESGIVVTGFDPTDQLFKKIDLELPSAPDVLGPKLRNVVADLLLWQLEVDEGDEQSARRVAELFDYTGFEVLVDAAELAPEDFRAHQVWRHRTILIDEVS